MANSLYLRWFYIVLFGSTKCGVLPVCYSNSFLKRLSILLNTQTK